MTTISFIPTIKELVVNEALNHRANNNFHPTTTQLFKPLKHSQRPLLHSDPYRKLFDAVRNTIWGMKYSVTTICQAFYTDFIHTPPTNIIEGKICIPPGALPGGEIKTICGLYFPNAETTSPDWILQAHLEMTALSGIKRISRAHGKTAMGIKRQELDGPQSIQGLMIMSENYVCEVEHYLDRPITQQEENKIIKMQRIERQMLTLLAK